MAIDYTRINWKNEPNETTPLSAENLNKMDKAIDDLATDVNSLEPNPVEVATEGLEKLAYGGTVYEVKGGHKIVNDNGVILAQKDNMKFGGVYSHNSSTMTEVDIVREFNSVSDIENLTGEEAKGFQYLDDDVYDEFTAGDIGFDNSDTSFVGTNVQDVLEEVDNKIDWTLLGNFKFADSGTSYDGDWNLTNNVPTRCNEICFYITVGGGDVGYMPRNSMVIPYSVFSTYKVYYDFNIGTSRVYLQVERVSDSKFKISGVSLGGLTSPMNIYAYAR